MLTEQQRNHFDMFGFLVIRQAFNPDEMSTISEQFGSVLDEDRHGSGFSGDRRQAVTSFVEHRPELSRLVDDDRIYCAIEELLGPDFIWIGSDGNLYVGDTSWHPDNRGHHRRIKIAFYLDPVDKDTGCLRVIPGSHRSPLHDGLIEVAPRGQASESPYGIDESEIPSFPLDSKPGDVVFFDQSIWHASFGGKTGRRMFTLNFGAKPKLESDQDEMRRTHQQQLREIAEMQFSHRDQVHLPAFLHSDSPRIRAMVSGLLEMGLE
jgi:ectoine hydroxylase-related dioxygenase (phytanoyl-CoA dioxygenase family)